MIKFIIKLVTRIVAGIVSKILMLIFAAYFCVSLLYFSLYRSADFEYVDGNTAEYLMTVVSQPVVDIFGNGKVGRSYNWETLDKSSKVAKASIQIPVTSDQSIVDSYNYYFNDLNSAVLAPANYQGDWRLVVEWQGEEGLQRQVSNISSDKNKAIQNTNGKKSVMVYGLDQNDSAITLKVLRYASPEELDDIILL